jgi:signal transduction histidine kinase
LEQLLKEFVANERKVIPQEIQLEITIDEEAPAVWITPFALRRVLDNLCRNACDAMRYGGELRIRLFARRLTAVQGADRLPPGHYAVIEVSDTGVGMSHEMLDTVFEPFFSTKGQGSGTGLGLWTVYKIIRRAGGVVHVRSRLGKGTRFTIYLPNTKPHEDQS